jgi:hypothetical protein
MGLPLPLHPRIFNINIHYIALSTPNHAEILWVSMVLAERVATIVLRLVVHGLSNISRLVVNNRRYWLRMVVGMVVSVQVQLPSLFCECVGSTGPSFRTWIDPPQEILPFDPPFGSGL